MNISNQTLACSRSDQTDTFASSISFLATHIWIYIRQYDIILHLYASGHGF